MPDLRPLPHIAAVKPYVPGGKLRDASGPVAMLASNENPFGPSPAAVEAMRAAAADVHIYPDPDYLPLRQAIAESKGMADPGRIVVSAGSDEIIHLLTQAYAGPGDEVLFTEHAFSMYRVSAMAHGARPVTAPETDLTAGVNAILGAVTEKTRILFLANPNNPTGTMLELKDLKRLQSDLPANVLFVIDGAYAEYLGPDYEAELRDLVDQRETTVMIRTFSKICGLAAIRLGWAYMPAPVTQVFQKLRGPFNVNGLAVAAGIASLRDTAFIERSVSHNRLWRENMTTRLNAIGLPTPPSHANFVVPEFGSAEAAAAADAFLRTRNILVRALGGYGLPSRLRITVGSADDNERVLTALQAFMQTR